MKKAIKIIGFILIELLIVVGCVSVGSCMNSSAEGKEPLTINKIALVNLDDGIEIGGAYKYYGVEFISELDDNFEITSLEQARRGLENDLYAAYIIIPATFSKNIESINVEPVKSNITYKINPDLDNQIREEVVTDIWRFNNSLSTNIEYVYIDAILREVHTVQDGANALLANDLKDLQAVLKFTETDLIVDPEYPDEKHVDNNIERLDLSEIYARMQTVFSELSSEYQSSQAGAQQEYDKLIEDITDISDKMEELNTEIDQVADIDEGEEFNLENDEEIDNYINSYNDDLLAWKEYYDEQAAYNFDEYMDYCQIYTNEQLTNLNIAQKDQIKEFYNTAYDECGKITKNALSIEEEGLKVYRVAQNIISDLKSEIHRLNREIKKLNDQINALQKDLKDGSLSGIVTGTPTSQDILDRTYENDLSSALESDIEEIKKVAQFERNVALRASITEWLEKELIYYGVPEEIVNELIPEEMNGEEAAELIDDWYETDVDLSIEPVEEESSQETTEDSPGEDSNDTEKTERDIRLEKRVNLLFANAYEPSLVDVEILDSLITGVVVSPIVGSIMEKYTELATRYTTLNTAWSNWSAKLKNFTINSYGDEKKRQSIENSFNGNMQNIQTKVNEKSTEFETYVTQTNEANSSNLKEWEASIQAANKETHTNIDNNIKNIMSNREQMNASNTDLMNNILGVLPYSRVGELENRNVYSYITSPIAQEDLSENRIADITQSKDDENENADDNRMELVLLSIGIILCLSGVGFLIKQMRKRNKYLQKQDLI